MVRPAAVVTWAGPAEGALVEVSATGAAARAVGQHLPALVADRVAGRTAAKDPTLWGEARAGHAARHLGWVGLPTGSRELLAPLGALRAELAAEGVHHVLVLGMGGAALAPRVLGATAGAPLVVLDSTAPDRVRRALDGDLARTVVVVSSKSGRTLETDALRRAVTAEMAEEGLDVPSRLVAVTDAGSPLEALATAEGWRAVFTAPADVGGRFSALSAYGVVPAALAGVEVGQLLDDAAEVSAVVAEDTEANPALVLAAALAGSGRRTVVLHDRGSGLVGLTDWVEALVAESTGKDGRGLVPVVVDAGAPELRPAPDRLPVLLTPLADEPRPDGDEPPADAGTEVTVSGTLGGSLVLWEHAVAACARLLDVNPFDQPDIEATKHATRDLLEGLPDLAAPEFTDSGVEVRGARTLLGDRTVASAVAALLAAVPEDGYLAVIAFVDPHSRGAESLRRNRAALAARVGRPVTLGWGPRCLHSTGQLHKGGPQVGAFLQITTEPAVLVDVPGRDFDLGTLVRAQAAADARVLAGLGRPVLRLHATGPDAMSWLTGLLGGPSTA